MPTEAQNPLIPVIPETITVHLGSPSSNAPNVTVSFSDYIKNVASSELYPTWPEPALRANILAQISFALSRIYTEYYRSRGYKLSRAIIRSVLQRNNNYLRRYVPMGICRACGKRSYSV